MFKSNTIPTELRDYRKIKGCNPTYMKFKNSIGGYSYWLFENWTDETSNSDYGVVEKQNNIYDLGNEEQSKITVFSKVPSRYNAMMSDLIVSEEIYLYRR